MLKEHKLQAEEEEKFPANNCFECSVEAAAWCPLSRLRPQQLVHRRSDGVSNFPSPAMAADSNIKLFLSLKYK